MADFARQGLLEPLDYKVIDAKVADPSLAQPNWVGWYYFSTLMAWNRDAIKGAQPTGGRISGALRTFPGRARFTTTCSAPSSSR